MNISDAEVWSVIRNGALMLCEEARQKWMSGKYGPADTEKYRENIERWYKIEDRIRVLLDRCKESGVTDDEDYGS